MKQKLELPKPPKKKRKVYLDNAAATQMPASVCRAMLPWLYKQFGNPSSIHSEGRMASLAIENARQTAALFLRATKDTITFTSGGTESNNLALLGSARANKRHGDHIITCVTEHNSVLKPLKQLGAEGFNVTYLPVSKYGDVSVADIIKALTSKTILVSIQSVNNEIGTINRIAEIGRALLRWRKEKKQNFPFFHSDAAAAVGMDLAVDKLHVDLLTISGSKIYGPKGSGILYHRRGVLIEPLTYGGGQEEGVRSGTQNVPCIIGMAKAMRLTRKNSQKININIERLRDYFWKRLNQLVPDVKLNGQELNIKKSKTESGTAPREFARLPGNLNVNFSGIDGESLVLYLDAYGIMCATGSACDSVEKEESHVLRACGLTRQEIAGCVRFTLGKTIKREDIDYVLRYLPRIVSTLRKIAEISDD